MHIKTTSMIQDPRNENQASDWSCGSCGQWSHVVRSWIFKKILGNPWQLIILWFLWNCFFQMWKVRGSWPLPEMTNGHDRCGNVTAAGGAGSSGELSRCFAVIRCQSVAAVARVQCCSSSLHDPAVAHDGLHALHRCAPATPWIFYPSGYKNTCQNS